MAVALDCRRTRWGAGDPLTGTPQGFFVAIGWWLSCWQMRPASCPWKERSESTRGCNCRCVTAEQQGPEGEARCGISLLSKWDTVYVCTQQMYSWPFGDGLNQSRPCMEARDHKPSEQKGVAWVPWDVLSSGEKDDLLPAISLLHLTDHVWS